MATQGAHGRLVAARRTAKTQVDTARIEGIQRTKLLGNHQRGMVRQHHATGAKVQRGGVRRQVTNQHGGRGTGDTNHIVVLSQPVTVITAFFCQASEIERVGKGFSC